MVNFILGGSRERMLEIAFGDQKVNLAKGADNSHLKRSKDIEQWAKDMYYFVSDRWGEENIAGFRRSLGRNESSCASYSSAY